MWNELAQILLGGVQGAGAGLSKQLDYTQKKNDMLELAGAKRTDDLKKSILTAIAGSAAKQAVKSGSPLDFTGAVDSPLYKTDPNMALLQMFFKKGYSGGSSGIQPVTKYGNNFHQRAQVPAPLTFD